MNGVFKMMLVGASLALFGSSQLQAVTYTAVDLGTFSGNESIASFVNDSGLVVGYSLSSNGYHAFTYRTNSGLVDIGTLGGSYSFPNAVSSAGHIVGFSAASGGSAHAFLWTTNGGMQDLGTLGGAESSALGVNSAGDVVGYAQNASGAKRAFLWTSTNGMQDLGAFAGGTSQAQAINSLREIVGWSSVNPSAPNTSPHAFRWTASGGMVDLGTLAGERSVAYLIGTNGTIAGSSSTASIPEAVPQAFRLPSGGSMQSLGTLGGSVCAVRDMNSLGSIVGYSELSIDEGGYTRPMLWTTSGGLTNLGFLGGTNSQGQALAINDAGQVVGFFQFGDGSLGSFLWSSALGMIALPTFGGDSQASDINSAGIMVGYSSTNGNRRACLWRPATAVELLNTLVNQVIALNLARGIQNSLDAKLSTAIHALDDANTNNNTSAVVSLGNFITAVQAQSGGTITTADATALIAAANEILALF